MKPLGRAAARRAAKLLRGIRDEADERVGSRCDIVGSMIGVKVRGGEALPRPCLTYFVREKIPVQDISPRERIPSRMIFSGNTVPTDVIAWPKMVLHGLQHGRFLRDGYTQGTLTAFAASPFGRWGLSCGHCMLGPDQKPYTRADIEMHDAGAGAFVPAGSTAQTFFSPGGELVCGTVGYIDCGLFSLQDESLRARGDAAPALATVDLASLPDQRLVGVSVMAAGGTLGGPRAARVIGIDQFGIDDYSDVVLMAEPPGMVHGDSGMLWLTTDGRAAAIHCRGEEVQDADTGSVLVTAMSARRAAEVLNVTLRRA